ncbi:MAG: hypothetical protein LLG09_04890 [Negativicutes bacterium]|nr:hypothetical protein [Negativicutes bacterium]
MAVFLFAVSFYNWKIQENRSLSELSLHIDAIAQACSAQIELKYDKLCWEIAQLADTMSLEADLANNEVWSSEAGEFLKSFPEVRLLALVSPDMQIDEVIPAQGNESLLHSSALQEISDSSEIRIRQAIDQNQVLQGFVLGILDSNKLILPVLPDLKSDYLLKISSPDQTIFRSADWESHQEEFTVTKTVTLLNSAVWNISFAPTSAQIQNSIGAARNTFLYSILISAFGLISVCLAQNYYKKSKMLSIHQEELIQYQNQLIAVNKELESFTYSVSHDLRAPLRHMSGFAEMLNKNSEGQLDEKSQHYLAVILEASQTMGRLIDDLLAFSKISRQELMNQQVNLNELLSQVIASMQPDIIGRKIEWKIMPLPEVTADRNMIRLVLENLISNSLKFTRLKMTTKIEIAALPDQVNEKYIVIYVKDNGAGFDMRYKDKLFGIFQRLHTVEEFEGTGVGLANVQRIVQRHGGRVWAEGVTDEGATFYFSLPKYQEDLL